MNNGNCKKIISSCHGKQTHLCFCERYREAIQPMNNVRIHKRSMIKKGSDQFAQVRKLEKENKCKTLQHDKMLNQVQHDTVGVECG